MYRHTDDGTSTIILRCMNAAGRLGDFVVPSSEQPATELVLDKHKLSVHFRAAVWEPEVEDVNEVLCQFRVTPGEDALLFEARLKDYEFTNTTHAAVQGAGKQLRDIDVRRKVSGVTKLPLGSTINFSKEHFQFQVMAIKNVKPRALKQRQSTSMDAVSDDGDTIAVASKQPQVASSSQEDDVVMEKSAKVDARVESESLEEDEAEQGDDDESEVDVEDSVFSTNGATTSFKTPATAPTTIGTVQNSPEVNPKSGLDQQAPDDDGFNFDPSCSGVQHPDSHSPLTKKSHSQSQGWLEEDPAHNAKVTVMSEELGEDIFPSDPVQKKTMTTYAGKSRNVTPHKTFAATAALLNKARQDSGILDHSAVPDTKDETESEDEDEDNDDRILKEGLEAIDAIEVAPPTTSDRDEHNTAIEVAARTMGSRKRKAQASEDLEDERTVMMPPGKKAKGLLKVALYEQIEEQSSGLQSSMMATTPSPPRQKSKGLPKAALYDEVEVLPSRRSLAKTSTSSSPRPQQSAKRTSTQDSADNITVATSTTKSKLAKPARAAPRSKFKKQSTAQIVISSSSRATPVSRVGTTTAPQGKVPKVLITQSEMKADKALARWLKSQGSEVIEVVPSKRTHFLCVVPAGDIPKTSKALRTLALRKQLVTEDWLRESQEQKKLLEPLDYVHPYLEDDETDIDRSKIFSGITVIFTTKLMAEYGIEAENVIALAQEAGAALVDKGSALHGNKTAKIGRRTIFLGSDKADPDVAELIKQYGYDIYHKDLLKESVLAGELLVGEKKFQLKMPTINAPKRKSRG